MYYIDQYWTKFHSEEHGGFDIVASWNYENIPIADCFDDSCYDIKDLERKVNDGTYQWFVLRVQVFLNGAELGCNYLGGCMYENVEDVLTDDMYEDVRFQAITEAEKWLTTVFKERKLIEYTVQVNDNGDRSWYLNGKKLTEEEFNAQTNTRELTVNEIEQLLGYKIKVVGNG